MSWSWSWSRNKRSCLGLGLDNKVLFTSLINRLSRADGHDGRGTLHGRLASIPRQASDRPALHTLDDRSHLRCQFPRQRSALLRERCPVHSVSTAGLPSYKVVENVFRSLRHPRLPFKVIQVVQSRTGLLSAYPVSKSSQIARARCLLISKSYKITEVYTLVIYVRVFQGHSEANCSITGDNSQVSYATVQSIPCANTSLTILIQSPGPLQTYDGRLMRIYVWLYCVLGIFMPLTLLAVGNCGLVRAVRRSTRLRRQFHVRNAHIDANERVTTVLATIMPQGHSRSYDDVSALVIFHGDHT